MIPCPMQCLHRSAMSSEVVLLRVKRNGSLSFHTSPVTQFRRLNSLARWFPCATKTRPPTPRSVSTTKNLILASKPSGLTKPEKNVPSSKDGDLVRLARRLVLGRNVQDPIRVDVESDFNLRQATRRWRDFIEISSKWNFPSKLLPSVIARFSLKTCFRTPGWLSTCFSISLRGKGSVAFDELRHGITCCLKKH